MSTIIDYIKKEYERILEQEKERKPVYRLVAGDNKILIDLTREWRTTNTRFGEKVFRPVYGSDKKEYVLMLNPNSRLYRALVKKLYSYVEASKDNGELYMVPVNIVKTTVNNKPMYEVEILEARKNKKREGKK